MSASTFFACLQSVRNGLIGIGDFGLNVTVLPKLMPEHIPGAMPGIIVTVGGPEELRGGTNAREDIGFPVLCGLFAADAPSPQSPLETYHGWREDVSDYFRFRRLNGVPECYTVIPRYGPPWDQRLPAYDGMLSAITLLCVCRIARKGPPPRPLTDEGGVILVDEGGLVLTEPGG